MKKIFIYILISYYSFSQIDTNIYKYFPLNIGNRWTWSIDQYWNPGPGYESIMIISRKSINNHFYFKTKHDVYYFYNNQHYTYNDYIRIDSSTGNLYYYDISEQIDCLKDSLNSSLNDSTYYPCFSDYWIRYDTGSTNIFNQNNPVKEFSWSNYFEAGGGHMYAKNLGKIYEVYGTVHGSTYWYLEGCLINGFLYGDTSIYLGINHIDMQIAKSFSLSQNYPNPFNPVTKIRFSIPQDSRIRGNDKVVLKVYDALGREVQTLVNESLLPGTYEVDFPAPSGDGSNFSSGVYYYTLSSGNYFETKKMVLLR